MIRQDDNAFTGAWIEKTGCAFFSVLFFLNKYKNITFNQCNIPLHLEGMKGSGCFTNDMLIYWEQAFAYFGLNVKRVAEEADADFCLYNWYNPRTGLFHFTPGEAGICLFDPLGLSITVAEGDIHSKRCFRILP